MTRPVFKESSNENNLISYVRKPKCKPMQIFFITLICLLLALLTILLLVYFFKPSIVYDTDQIVRDYENYSLGKCILIWIGSFNCYKHRCRVETC